MPRFPLRSVLALAAMTCALLLIACGDDGPSGGQQRTVTDESGAAVAVPQTPKRVVALSESTLDGALALGVKPVGTTAGRGQRGVSAYLAARSAGIPIVASLREPDLEAIARLRPDLILVDATTGARNFAAQLRKLAPVVMVSGRGAQWREAFVRLADVLGRRAQGDAALAGLDARVRTVKPTLSDPGAVVSIVRWADGAPGLVGKGGHSAAIVEALGLKRPASQDRTISNRTPPVSLEELGKIDGDWIFVGALGGVDAGRAAVRQARAVPAFRTLKAVKAGHVVAVDGSAWTSSGGPLAARTVLDEVAAALRR